MMRQSLMAAAIVAFIITFFCYRPMPDAQDEPQRKGEIIEIEGRAEVKVAGSDAWIPAELRMEIRSGDFVRALKGSYTDLSIDKQEERNAIVRVGESSAVTPYIFESEVIINVVAGKIVFWCEKIEKELEKFEIRTPNSIIGVEGSHGVVNYDERAKATDSYLEVSGGYVVNVDSGKLEELYRGPNFVQVKKNEIDKKKRERKIYSWDLGGFFVSHAFTIRGLNRKGIDYTKYSKSYFTGKYASTIDCITGEVIVAPYNEIKGPNFPEGITLYTGQRIRTEDFIFIQLDTGPKKEEPALSKKIREKEEEEEQIEKKKEADNLDEREEEEEEEEEEKKEEELELKEKVEDTQKDVP